MVQMLLRFQQKKKIQKQKKHSKETVQEYTFMLHIINNPNCTVQLLYSLCMFNYKSHKSILAE